MKINKNNYEAFFLDFIEGNLSVSQQAELDLFLAENPDLKFELDSFEEIIIPAVVLDNEFSKSELKRNEETGLNEIDYLLISELENTLSKEEGKALANLSSGKRNFDKERSFYLKTKLNPVEKIVFPNKDILIKKPAKVVYFYRIVASVAAAILALFIFNINFTKDQYVPRKTEFKKTEIVKEVPFELPNIKVEDKNTKESNLEKKKILKKESKPILIYSEEKPVKSTKVTLETEKPIVKALEEETFAEIPIEEMLKKEISSNFEPIEVEISEKLIAQVSKEDEFIPIGEFAKNKFKESVLKNKTLAEILAEEIAAASNQKISFEAIKNQEGKTEQLAINIGKFSFSRKK